MSAPILSRKPKLHFDTSASPSHVTFDDGKNQRRNFPWMHYIEGRCDYHEPDAIRVEIGEWLIVLRGHNLGPLFVAIEDKTLTRVRAFPEFSKERERESDSFVTEIRFGKPLPKMPGGSGGQISFDLAGS